jgi:hypothetical protein
MGKFSLQMSVQFTAAPYLGEGDVDNIHGSGKGDVAQHQPIHIPVNDSLRNSHTVREKCAGALSC